MSDGLDTIIDQLDDCQKDMVFLELAKYHFQELKTDFITTVGCSYSFFDSQHNLENFYKFWKASYFYLKNGSLGRAPDFWSFFLKVEPVPKNKSLSDLSPKDKIWDKHRANSDLIRDSYLRCGYERYAERIDRCSTFLEFAKVLDDKEFIIKLITAHFCRHRHCIVCQWRKTLKWTAKFLEVMPKILRDYPHHRFIFLTLTVKNCDVTELRDTISLMNKAWKRLIERKSFPADGFIKSMEVTRVFDCWDGSKFVGTHGKTFVKKWEKENKRKLRLVDTNFAHPHFHVLMMVPSGYFTTRGGYLSHDKWMELWRKCLRIEYDPTVNIKAIKPKSEDSLVDALRETLKYSLKPDDLIVDTSNLTPIQIKDKDNWLIEITKQLHKTRTISLGGVFKKYISEVELEDLINIDDEKNGLEISNERFRFDWKRESKLYIQRKDED